MSEPDESLGDLQGELRYLLNRWDPIGVYDEEADYPPDEYDCMIGPLLGRLARGDSRGDLRAQSRSSKIRPGERYTSIAACVDMCHTGLNYCQRVLNRPQETMA